MDPIGIGRSTDERELCKQSAKHQYVRRAFHRDARVTSVPAAPTGGLLGRVCRQAAQETELQTDLTKIFFNK